MKVFLNLASTPSRRERYALVWTLPAFVIGLVALVYLSGVALHDFYLSRRIRSSLADVQTREANLRSREAAARLALARPEFQQVIHETEFVNHLIEQRQFSLTELTVKVSKLLPSDVKLDGLGLAGSDSQPEVQFAVMGKSEEAIESFLSKLEDSKDFSNVTIKNQGFREGPEGGSEQVALICTARYLAGIPVSSP